MTATATAALLVGFVALIGVAVMLITICEGLEDMRSIGYDEPEDV